MSEAGPSSTATPAAASSKSAAAGSGAKAAGKAKGLITAAAKEEAASAKAVIALKKSALAALHKPDVFVRIRPLAIEGGHAEDGTVLTKHLETWDETSVTVETQYLFSKGENKYAYPKRVFGTEATQKEYAVPRHSNPRLLL